MAKKCVTCIECNYQADKKNIDPWLFVKNNGAQLVVIAAPFTSVMKGKPEDWLIFCKTFCLFSYMAKWYSHKIYRGNTFEPLNEEFIKEMHGMQFGEDAIGKPHQKVQWVK